MQKSYEDYLKLKIEGRKMGEIVNEARHEYLIEINPLYKETYVYKDIPFNLERMYLDELIEERNFLEAEKVLKRMRCSYPDVFYQNTIESFEYHLRSIIQSERMIQNSISEAKKEFNQHTITLVSIVVGIITIFGSANAIFEVDSYKIMLLTFITIVASIIAVIMTVTIINLRFPRR